MESHNLSTISSHKIKTNPDVERSKMEEGSLNLGNLNKTSNHFLTGNPEEDYAFLIETPEVIMEYYKNQPSYSLEKYFIEIEDWLKKKPEEGNNVPLVIEADDGIGKKTLIVKWIEHHIKNSRKHYKDIIIPHFASAGGNNSNYHYSIYRILIKLREYFNIKQKVELLEEKIRKNFYYWLDICSRKIMKNVTFDGDILIIIEGMEHFKSEDGNEESNLKFWLPKLFPDRVRFIITCDQNSASYNYLKDLNSSFLSMKADSRLNKLLENLYTRKSICSQEWAHKCYQILEKKHANGELDNTLYIKTFVGAFVPNCIDDEDGILKNDPVFKKKIEKMMSEVDFDRIDNIHNVEDLMDYILEFFEVRIMHQRKFEKVCVILILTFKGLSYDEINRVVNFERYEWEILKSVFKSFFFTYKGLWKVSNDIFKKVVEKKYLKNKEFEKQVRIEIAFALDKSPNSIRKLEEKTNNLYKAEDWANLKHTLSLIESFLLLFNPFTKYDLCRYWQILQDKGFDPVDQYNSGLEQWEMQYNPKEEELFTIILQICRFLKEFTDFETNLTPTFSHPFVKNKITQFKASHGEGYAVYGEEPKKSTFANLKTISDKNTVNQSKQNQSKLSSIKGNQKVDEMKRWEQETKDFFRNEDGEISDRDEGSDSEEKDDNRLDFLDNIGINFI